MSHEWVICTSKHILDHQEAKNITYNKPLKSSRSRQNGATKSASLCGIGFVLAGVFDSLPQLLGCIAVEDFFYRSIGSH